MDFRQRTDAEGREKLVLVEHVAEHPFKPLRAKESPAAVAPQPVAAWHSMYETCLARSRRLSRNHCIRLRNPGSRPMTLSSRTSTANSGMIPTIERMRSGYRLSVDVQMVVVKSVLFVPKPAAAEGVHGVGDGHEVLEELRGHVFVGRIFLGQLQRHGEHRDAVKRHPGRAVGLLQAAAVGQRLAIGRRRRCCPAPGIRRKTDACPATSLRLTHQVKLISSFWKTRARNSRSRAPRGPVIL